MVRVSSVHATRNEANEAAARILARYPVIGYGTVVRVYQTGDGRWEMSAEWWSCD